MADNGVAGARSRSSEVVLSPGVRPGVFRGPWRAVLRYAGSCLVFKYEFVAPDPRILDIVMQAQVHAQLQDRPAQISGARVTENGCCRAGF